jgi:hypothetical protein
MRYRRIVGFKYELASVTRRHLPDWEFGAVELKPFISISEARLLTVRKGYPWDGPSGPTRDRKENILPSLFHDVLYELCRASVVPWQACQLYADRLMRDDCIAAGMSPFWARNFYYRGLRLFGGKSAKPQPSKKYEVYEL